MTETVPDGDRGGETYVHDRDYDRLNAQQRAVFELMQNRDWWTYAQIAAKTRYPEGSIGARIRDLQKREFGGWRVEREHVSRGLHRYRWTGDRLTEAEMSKKERIVAAVSNMSVVLGATEVERDDLRDKIDKTLALLDRPPYVGTHGAIAIKAILEA